ncbi:MAG: ferritin [Synergistales bacterium]|nr:ferritin [Synergistales bacterium]
MLSEKLWDALNDQVNAELHSAYVYLSMASWLEDASFQGMAKWMKAQANEEMEHAMKFYGYINDRRSRVELKPIDGPKTSWNSPLEAFEDAFEHEQYISGRIHSLLDIAHEERDYPTQEFLQWFVKEQVEEEASVDEVVQQLKMVQESRNGLFMLDRKLGEREEED